MNKKRFFKEHNLIMEDLYFRGKDENGISYQNDDGSIILKISDSILEYKKAKESLTPSAIVDNKFYIIY